VLNVFTPALSGGRNRPVMVWLHGGGFSSGSGSTPILDGANLARSGDVVVVTINHRLNVFGFAYLGEAAGSDFALLRRRRHARHRGGVAMGARQHRSLRRRSQSRHHLRTIGWWRKVATLMANAGSEGVVSSRHHRERSRAAPHERADAIRATDLLLAEVGLGKGRARELQNVPMDRLLAANAAVNAKLPSREPGMTANSPTVDGRRYPTIRGIRLRRGFQPAFHS
jgi:para-nitrobenzyl esterase